MTPPSPSLILISTFSLLQNRKKKHLKLVIMKEKSLARRAQQEAEGDEPSNSQGMILWELNQSKFSDVNSQKEDNDDHDSYDSDPFMAYEEGQQAQNNRTHKHHQQDISIINLREPVEHCLMLDFKADEVPKHNPISNYLPPKTVSRQVQTMPIEVLVNSKIQKEKQPIRAVPIPELKKEIMPKIRENAVLTESIEMPHSKESQVKGRGSTFMDYYNSQPVKTPSNILEKYIKRKK